MRFNDPMYTVEQQNSVCMSCHLPEQLQKAFWPHDVHVTKVTCASCIPCIRSKTRCRR
ncbi:cytochrome c nitrite reductase pentaheme subunit [Salmonella enterica subsp. enterica]|uniref:Cytochrome c nitrite reductase pentaheme subunit n=1 Tax=Salmonella enterica I TaxID=59201 RepID=A0A379WHE2_SALET|nr:cytochrome c nitrite reductase pentaheme subunit [Salmonella enterica subsp. enterica]